MTIVGLTFRNNTLVVQPGEKVSLDITNCATFQHNFFSPALKVDPATIIPGASAHTTVSFTTPSQPGMYMFWCSTKAAGQKLSHGERGMTGEVIVQ